MSPTDAVQDYLLVRVLLSVAAGIAAPEIAVITRASTAILAVMIGSISLTLSVEQFRGIDPRMLGLIVAGHAAMPSLGVAIARGLGLSPEDAAIAPRIAPSPSDTTTSATSATSKARTRAPASSITPNAPSATS